MLLSRVPGLSALPSLKFQMFAVMTQGDGDLLLVSLASHLQLRSWRDLGGALTPGRALALSSCPLPGLTRLPNPFLSSLRATQLWGEALSFPIPVFLSPSGPLQQVFIISPVFSKLP